MSDLALYTMSCFAAGAGFASAYAPVSLATRLWLRQREFQPLPPEQHPAGPDGVALSAERARELLSQLHDVATGVAGDVRAHTTAMQGITTELQQMAGQATGSVESEVMRVIADIVAANVKLQQQLDERAKVIDDQARQIQMQWLDPLTGIPNRGAFDHEIKRRLAEWKRHQLPCSLILLDVDHFKKFNDGYGHLAGDFVLKGVAAVCSKAVREVDLAARYGGEEFAAILPNTHLDDAKCIAERLRRAIEEAQFEFEGRTFQVTASVGVTQTMAIDEIENLVKRSDQALYAAKHAGRNRSYFHNGRSCFPIQVDLEPQNSSCTCEEPTAASASQGVTESPVPPITSNHEHPSDPETTTHHIDSVTGLPNRQAFQQQLRRRLAEWRRENRPLSLILITLDTFDTLQMRHGQPAVNLVVNTLRQFLAAALREMDCVARTSDREFALLLPSCNLGGAVTVAERVRTAIAKCDLLRYSGVVLRFSVSCGVVEMQTGNDAATLMERVSKARQAAQEAGGNVTWFHDGTSLRAAEVHQRGTLMPLRIDEPSNQAAAVAPDIVT